MEEYHVSLKIMQALTDMGLHVPKDISLVGIDELPEYWMRDEYRLTTLKIEHAQRAQGGHPAFRAGNPGHTDSKIQAVFRMLPEYGKQYSLKKNRNNPGRGLRFFRDYFFNTL